MKFKEAVGKFWHLIWKDNSPKGWFLSLLFIFVVIKFIFFPLLSLATGTQLPLAIVESCSMYHKGNLFSDFDSWYERHEEKYFYHKINSTEFSEFNLHNGFTKGDILLITGTDTEKLEVGDIIIFDGGQRNPIIHRVISIAETSEGRKFSTLGDNNNGQLTIEKNVAEDQIMGKAQIRLAPYFGWVKLVFFEWQKPYGERGFCREN